MKYLKSVSILCAVLAVSGCSIFGEKIAGEVANAIDDYCKEPQNQREVYRDAINDELAADGHSISVTCSGDITP